MGDRKVVNPRMLLPLAMLAAFLFTMIAIFLAVSYSPDSGRDEPAPPVTTSATPSSSR